jgi:hypothetical protein
MIEVNSEFVESKTDFDTKMGTISITPPVGAEYFLARVPLFKDQAIVIFPKFFTIGCGFAQEENWNVNLPIRTCSSQEIYEHIKGNKKYDEITEEQCISAIDELRKWAEENIEGFKRRS